MFPVMDAFGVPALKKFSRAVRSEGVKAVTSKKRGLPVRTALVPVTAKP